MHTHRARSGKSSPQPPSPTFSALAYTSGLHTDGQSPTLTHKSADSERGKTHLDQAARAPGDAHHSTRGDMSDAEINNSSARMESFKYRNLHGGYPSLDSYQHYSDRDHALYGRGEDLRAVGDTRGAIVAALEALVLGESLCQGMCLWLTVTVTVTDDLLNTKLLSAVSGRLSQPVQSPNYMQWAGDVFGFACDLECVPG
jgi:hypothetical protein